MNTVDIHIGLDDIDSPSGGCTTHFCSIAVERLNNLDVRWQDYPNLIRLNPAVPYRTRGNGAVALRFRVEQERLDEVTALVQDMIAGYVTREYPNTNPGFALVQGPIPPEIAWISRQALWRVLPRVLAQKVAKSCARFHYSEGNSRGLVGALAAIGNTLEGDHTYEYIAYRGLDDCREERGVDHESVREMDRAMKGHVFNNIDDQSGRVIVDPHGPDPVMFGIRGETPEAVIRAGSMVKTTQHIERWMVFRTNQGTGAHLEHLMQVDQLRPYMTATVDVSIRSRPDIIEGGHVIVRIGDDTGEIDAAAYEPTGSFREAVKGLRSGDKCRLHGSVRPASRTHGRTLNLEGLEVQSLAPQHRLQNPLCPECGKRLKSAGREKGFKCATCGFRSSEIPRISTEVRRTLRTQLYLPPQRAQRHLTRPVERQDKSNSGVAVVLLDTWSVP